jgi:photosystem II stability/assembly factor-like uncharacterized protein
MKRQKRTILGVFLTLMLLGSLVAAVAPVSASTLSWGDEDIPDTGGKVLMQLDDSPNDVYDLAAFDEDIIFAVGGTADNDDGDDSGLILKSTNGGDSWSIQEDSDLDDYFIVHVAVASDDEDLVVAAGLDTSDGVWEVFISTNGGSSWSDLEFDVEATLDDDDGDVVHDLAISSEEGGSHFIAVVGMDGFDAVVWSWEVGATITSWDEVSSEDGFEADLWTGSSAGAVAFSPSFAGDQFMLVVTAGGDGTDTEVYLEIYSFNLEEWNTLDDYPVEILSASDPDNIGWGYSASITLDPEYLGSDDAMRLAFVGLALVDESDVTHEDSGIYRVDDTTVDNVKDDVLIHSVAYDGTNLVAGRLDDNHVYYSDDPLDSSPTVKTTRSTKRPGGDDMVLVAWAGENVVAGTAGDESAFAVSTDLGATFNDISLIDTALDYVTDMAISADGSTTYLVSDDGDDLSVWRMASDWIRVLSVQDETHYMVRLAPDDPDVVYIAEKGDNNIYYSKDGGLERWQTRSTGSKDIQDLAIETEGDVAYLLQDDGDVSKSSNSGFTWGSDKDTGLDDGYSIRSLDEDLVIVGSADGHVSYSSDGGSSWDDISEDLQSSANVSVIASGLDDGDFIYAATDNWGGSLSTIERWEIGESSSWKELAEADDGDWGVYGIDLVDGILYAVTSNGSSSSLMRTIGPTSDSVSFDEVGELGVAFITRPQALRASAGSTILWAIDNVPGDEDELYSFKDTLTTAVPTLVAPAQDAFVKVNPITGRAVMVSFIWESPSDDVEDFDLEIAFDDDFDEVVKDLDVGEDGDEGDTITIVIGPYGDEAEGELLEWTYDTVYFWRVRVSGNDPVKSNWSEVRRFTIEEAMVQPPVVVDIPPVPPAPDITVTVPDVIVNIPPVVEVPPTPAPITPAWIWVLVIIGGVLLIFLIVLIIRTRRAV